MSKLNTWGSIGGSLDIEITSEDVIRFWLGKEDASPLENAALWWIKDDSFDREIKERFEKVLEQGVRGELASWDSTPRGRLALVILYDQLSRNMFRGTPRSFAQDSLALAISTRAIETGDECFLSPVQMKFMLMPFMHAEDVLLQQKGLDGFIKLQAAATDEMLQASFANSVKYARLHMVIIERFGRFPHRNEILGRTSTAEEIEFLKRPYSSF